ncbi:hypothetical protein [Gracilimonas sp. BCB1]|uniref:hypothetical protein n=1 Tax=Gracilimonas sp. BCB1 TaxID=3152362 RepID=UPI0032D98E72
MKTKLLNIGLILSSFLVYFEWGVDYNTFLIEIEIELFSKFLEDPLSVFHPLIVIPLIGQVLLIITLFQKKPGRMLSLSGLTAVGFLILLVSLIGLMGMNIRIFSSTLPFLILGAISIIHHRVKSSTSPDDKNNR